MSMSSFSITINNHSGVEHQFLLFQDMPNPTNGPSGAIFTHVYQCSPKVQSGEDCHISFEMEQEYFAICGTARESSDGAIQVLASSSVPVKLGPGGSTVILSTQYGGPDWDKAAAAGLSTDAQGAFSIVTNTSSESTPNAVYIGCGARDPESPWKIIPLQTWIAEPHRNSQLFPGARYYICSGEYSPGTAIDPTKLVNVLSVDFTACTIPNASFTLKPNGCYVAEPDLENSGVKWSVR